MSAGNSIAPNPFDTSWGIANYFGVARVGGDGDLVILERVRGRKLGRNEALNLAAWLVVMADSGSPASPGAEPPPAFEKWLVAVRASEK